ncbi:Ig-like domain-containing protein [Nitrosomonas sp. Is24]|uniref:Ig-like domain-containing protein n=1 Tax=Nitrosomonas sp. Is24 TaxID=3080533 RepID=UPI00294AB2AA|nr:Ig-like domain-containing protein [Nitrosomonas sp. Is24]MDV6342457.1 Ig-like domain-containing protein [Nitrosomonas sp. Is24]
MNTKYFPNSSCIPLGFSPAPPFTADTLAGFQQVLVQQPSFSSLGFDLNSHTLIIGGAGFNPGATASSYLDITKLQIKLNNSVIKTGAGTWVNSGSVTIVSETEIRIELTATGAAALEVSTLGGSTAQTFENWQLSSGFIVGTTASKSYEVTLTQTNSLGFVPNVDIDKDAPGYGLDDLRFVEEGRIGSNVVSLAIDGQGDIPLTRAGFKVENLDGDSIASLTATLTNAKDGDQLYLLSGAAYTAGGTAANGTMTVSGVELSYQIHTIGSLVDGTAQIVVTVTPAAGYASQVSNTIMEGVLNEIYFNNVTDNPDVENRIVTFSLTDAEGYTTLLPSEATINIYQANDKPVITLANTVGTYTETAGVDDGGNDVPLGFDISVTDADIGAELQYIKLSFGTSAIKDGAAEQLRIDGATAGDSIALDFADSTAIGPVTLAGVTYLVQAAVNGGTSTLTFTKDGGGNLTLSEGEALLDALRYNNTSDTPTQGDRQFSFVVKDTYTDPLDGDISIESDPVSFTVTVQGTPIGTPTIDLLSTSDTGTSITDDLTKETNPTIKVSLPNSGELAKAGDTLTIYDGATEVTTIILTADHIEDGYVDYTFATALSDGAHNLSATLTEAGANGLISTAAELTVTVDATKPTPATKIDSFSDDTGANTSDNLTKDTTPTLTITAEAGATVQVFRDKVLVGTATEVEGQPGSFTFTSAALGDGSYSFTAKVTDAAGNVSESAACVIAIDATNPNPATSIVSLSDDTGISGIDYVTSDNTPVLTITAEAESTVEVFLDDGSDEIFIGSANEVTGQSGTFTFDFVDNGIVELGDGEYDLIIKATDAAGNVYSTQQVITIDTTAPTATITVADDALKAGETSLVTITFSEVVSGFTNSDLTIANGTLSTVSSTDGGVTWTASFTPSTGIEDASNVITLASASVMDAAGNSNSGATDSNNYAIDTKRPTAAIEVAKSALKAGETSLVTITFSGAVSGFTNSDLMIANGTLTAVSSADGGVTWTAEFTPSTGTEDTTNVITLKDASVTNAAGNSNSGSVNSNNYAIDTKLPTATIVLADTALKAGEISLVTITFSEAVSGFTNSGLTIANGTLSTVSSADGIIWTATLTPSTATEDATNVITLVSASVTDAAGNSNSGSVNSNNYIIDTKLPTATIAVADTALKAGETSLVTITFSEAVSGFTNSDLTIANGTLSTVSSADGGVTWTASLTPSTGIEDASNVITLADASVTDAAGNGNSGSVNSNNYAIDTKLPTATIVVADTALKVGETSLVTITFSEAVSGFTNSDLTIANGTLSTVSSADGGITWTAEFTPSTGTEDATNVITLKDASVTNAAGNSNSGSVNSNNYAIDTKLPTATIVLADTALKAGESSLMTITFSEKVIGFDNSDLTITNGTLSPISSTDGGVTWTAAFTPVADLEDDTNVITLASASVTDVAGNSNSGSVNSENFTINTKEISEPPLPTVTNVDGVTVNTLSQADGSVITTIPVVAIDRKDDSQSLFRDYADIPLIKNAAGQGLLNVSLPVGAGLNAEGRSDPLSGNDAKNSLNQLIDKVASDETLKGVLKSGVETFLSSQAAVSPVVVQLLTPVVNGDTALTKPILISGTGQSDTVRQALIVDTSKLPVATVIQLDNIAFVSFIGSVHAMGGAGENFAIGDNAVQYIVLGADDDILHGGGGDDTVGSLTGNDQVFGDAGYDIVFGGDGNDLLSGGTGNDRINGGAGFNIAEQEGKLSDYELEFTGNSLKLANKASSETDIFTDIQLIKFTSGPALAIPYSSTEAIAHHLVKTWLGRDLTVAEGVAVQNWTAASTDEILRVFRSLPEAANVRDMSDEELLRDLPTDPNLVHWEVTHQSLVGTEANEVGYLPLGLTVYADGGKGCDILKMPGSRTDFHYEFVDHRLQLTRLSDGAMQSIVNAEAVAFDSGETIVIAQNQAQATLAHLVHSFFNRDVTADEWELGIEVLGNVEVLNESANFEGILKWFQEHSELKNIPNENYIQKIYEQTLGRLATEKELTDQLLRLENHQISREQLAYEVADSNEASTYLIGSVLMQQEWF